MTSSSSPKPPTGLLYRVDGESLNTLIEKYEQSISTNASEQERVEKLKQEYVTLKTKLTTLPLHLEYGALVPIGRRGLCPGKIIHTNEITCLIGENWFVECSASKAIELVNHRIAKLDEQHESRRKERELINNWKQEAERQLVETIGEGTVEIREDYDEEHEQYWRKQHRESIRRYHQQLAKDRLEAKQEKNRSNGELWSRLDELELQEELANYIEEQVIVEEQQIASVEEPLKNKPDKKKTISVRTDENETSKCSIRKTSSGSESLSVIHAEQKTVVSPIVGSKPRSTIQKRVKFSADNIIHDISDDISNENQEYYHQEKSTAVEIGFTDDGSMSTYPCFEPIMIRFRHSSLAEIIDDEDNNTSGTEEEDNKSHIVSSPGNIVNVFGPTSISAISNKPPPKSILKPFAPPLIVTEKKPRSAQGKLITNKKPMPTLEDIDDIDIESVTAVSKVVTERVPVFTNLQLNSATTLNHGETEPNSQSDKPVSLFKMRKQQTAGVTATSPN